MKKFTISHKLFDFLKESNFFSDAIGVLPLDSTRVTEGKLGSKFLYKINPGFYLTYFRATKFIDSQYLSHIPINKSACAYVKGKSYLDFLEPHRNNYFFIRLDLKSFFYSITTELVKSTVLEYFSDQKISDSCNQTHANALLKIISYKVPKSSENTNYVDKEVFPIGFPLSPIISNIAFRRTDILIERFCDQHDITYTRYADDMLFSARGGMVGVFERLMNGTASKVEDNYLHSDDFIKQISILLSVDGFKLNPLKTIKAINTLSINGYTISGVNFSDLQGHIRVSNKKTKIIEKLLYELKLNKDDRSVFKKCFRSEVPKSKSVGLSHGFDAQYCKDQINNKLIGYKSFLVSLLVFDEKLSCVTQSAKEKYAKIINSINKALNKRMLS